MEHTKAVEEPQRTTTLLRSHPDQNATEGAA